MSKLHTQSTSLNLSSRMMQDELDDIRLRLDRRNQLLEIVRKAYHRDVIVVREYLLHLQNGVNVQNIKPEDLNLRTIPSIDLRNEGFHLFSPQECELVPKPCLHCGGTFEIIHRESDRFEHLMRCCDDLKAREKDLDQNLAIAKQEIEVGKGAMLKQEIELTEEQDGLNATIDRLKKDVSDRNELERLCNKQREQIKNLEIIQEQKIQVENSLGKSQKRLTIVDNHFKLSRKTVAENKSTISKLTKRCNEGLLRERGLHNRVEQISNTNSELKCTISTLEELEDQVKGELKMCRSEMQRKDSIIRGEKDANKELEQKLAQTLDERNATVSDLEMQLRSAKGKIETLQQSLAKTQNKAASFKAQAELECRRMKAIEQARSDKDKANNDELSKKVNILTNLTSSHIQGLYDQCLEQEKILRLEGVLPSLGNKKKSSSSALEPLAHVEDSLANKKESIYLDWETILEDEINRRVVFGNLNNRAQINLGHIDRLIKRMHGKHSTNMKRLEDNHKNSFQDMCVSYDKRVHILEGEATQRTIELQTLSQNYHNTKNQLADTIANIDSLTKDVSNYKKVIESHELSLSNVNSLIASTQSELEKTKEKLISTQVNLQQSEIDIKDRDETLLQLEELLQNTTDRFAQTIEKERIRSETNRNVSIQAEPHVQDFQQQADFVKDVVGIRNATARGTFPTSNHFFDFNDEGSIK